MSVLKTFEENEVIFSKIKPSVTNESKNIDCHRVPSGPAAGDFSVSFGLKIGQMNCFYANTLTFICQHKNVSKSTIGCFYFFIVLPMQCSFVAHGALHPSHETKHLTLCSHPRANSRGLLLGINKTDAENPLCRETVSS